MMDCHLLMLVSLSDTISCPSKKRSYRSETVFTQNSVKEGRVFLGFTACSFAMGYSRDRVPVRLAYITISVQYTQRESLPCPKSKFREHAYPFQRCLLELPSDSYYCADNLCAYDTSQYISYLKHKFITFCHFMLTCPIKFIFLVIDTAIISLLLNKQISLK